VSVSFSWNEAEVRSTFPKNEKKGLMKTYRIDRADKTIEEFLSLSEQDIEQVFNKWINFPNEPIIENDLLITEDKHERMYKHF
jgi:hypothetical protein